MKTCPACNTEKAVDAFYKAALRSDGIEGWCKECIKEKRRIYRKSIRGKEAARNHRLRIKESKHAESLLRGAKRRAFDKGLPFELDVEWLESRLDKCELSGLDFVESNIPFMPLLASIDRIDSNKGYTKENSRVICYALNSAFNRWGSEVFEMIARAWLARLANA